MERRKNTVIIVDPSDLTREVLARRLRAQGYVVEETSDPAVGANMALAAPPAAVVADLWMPGISGVQLARLLRSEPATANVAIILSAETDEPRNRFWAERAGASAYIPKRRTGELVRSLARAIRDVDEDDDFFFQLSGGSIDVRDRIARYLDAALFDSVIAAEVRALASCGDFDRLFDLFVQFLAQVIQYRWVAICTESPARFALHHHPSTLGRAEEEARAVLGPRADAVFVCIEDEDAAGGEGEAPPIVRPILFGDADVGTIALSTKRDEDASSAGTLLSLIAGELGGPLRMTALIEEAHRLAATDALTGLMNRRAFGAAMATELARSKRHGYPLSVILLDIDHFKQINDRRGHPAGDRVLAAVGALLRSSVLRQTDLAARWGGEEFVVTCTSTGAEGALHVAERLRTAIEGLVIVDDAGERISITASLGVTELRGSQGLDDLVDQADRAMYASKASGRNRVTLSLDDIKAA